MLRALLLIACLLPCFPALAQGPGSYRVIDGDTIEAPFGVKYRLLGFDTPEIFYSKCDAEFELGMVAKERLEELLASGEVRVIESGRTDKYRRTLAHVEVDGRDVGEILIGEGFQAMFSLPYLRHQSLARPASPSAILHGAIADADAQPR